MSTEISDYTELSNDELTARIERLKREKNAVILAHNYQRLEVQAVGDYLGDSLGLSKEAAKSDADIIVFAGVLFMAETAKILSPDKKVLIPDINAGCPLANFADIDKVTRMRAKYPEHSFIAYVNTTAAVKSMVDICCTSSNAAQVVAKVDNDKVVFLPDSNLANFIRSSSAKEIIPWEGHCYVHNRITLEDIESARDKCPDFTIIVHPECPPAVAAVADVVGSTGDMVKYVASHPDENIILGTEVGMAGRLQKEHPEQKIIHLKANAICKTMKLITLPKVLWSLENEKWELTLPDKVLKGAQAPLKKMVEIG